MKHVILCAPLCPDCLLTLLLRLRAGSFVVVFDSLKSTKGYIQMKGRARQKDAKFFVFQNVEERSKTVLSLDSAQKIERRVSHFIASRASIDRVRNLVPTESSQPTSDVDDDELWAVEQGKYEAKHGTVDFFSAKSLVNRYVLSLPIDPIVRASKASVSLVSEWEVPCSSKCITSLILVRPI